MPVTVTLLIFFSSAISCLFTSYIFHRIRSQARIKRKHRLRRLQHDIRTPLTSLTAAFEALRDHDDVLCRGERKELLHMVETNLSYFQGLLEQLACASRGDQHPPLELEDIDLAELLGREIRSRQAASGARLTWEFTCSQESSTIIRGDSLALKRLFRNAFDNASRFAGQLVRVQIEALKDRVEVLVTDDGPGFSTTALTSFGTRSQDESSTSGHGSGIMKSMAEMHASAITIANQSGSGALVRISFPRS